jgi:hypothetical protein
VTGPAARSASAGSTLFPGQTNYLKLGLYRDAATQPVQVLYHDNMIVATTLADVAGSPPADGRVVPDAGSSEARSRDTMAPAVDGGPPADSQAGSPIADAASPGGGRDRPSEGCQYAARSVGGGELLLWLIVACVVLVWKPAPRRSAGATATRARDGDSV